MATPMPDTMPTSRPSASVRRMTSRLIGPTAAAIVKPRIEASDEECRFHRVVPWWTENTLGVRAEGVPLRSVVAPSRARRIRSSGPSRAAAATGRRCCRRRDASRAGWGTRGPDVNGLSSRDGCPDRPAIIAPWTAPPRRARARYTDRHGRRRIRLAGSNPSTTSGSPTSRRAARSMAARPASASATSSPKAGPILADGAMGTMLFANGLQFGDPPEVWNLTQPEVIRRIQRGYLDAGSRIIMTNTFGGNRLRLGLHGLSERVDELNRTAAILARAEVNAAGGNGAGRRRHRPERRDRPAARHARLRHRRRRLPRAGGVARRRRRRPDLDRDDVRPQRDQGRHRGCPARRRRGSPSSRR